MPEGVVNMEKMTKKGRILLILCLLFTPFLAFLWIHALMHRDYLFAFGHPLLLAASIYCFVKFDLPREMKLTAEVTVNGES